MSRRSTKKDAESLAEEAEPTEQLEDAEWHCRCHGASGEAVAAGKARSRPQEPSFHQTGPVIARYAGSNADKLAPARSGG